MLDEAVKTEPAEQGRQPARSRKRAVLARIPFRARLRRDWALLVMVAPTLVLLGLFHYFPLLGNIIAFQDYSPYIGILNSPFNGLENFQRLIDNPDFWNATLNTLTITAFQLVFYFPLPILLALLLNSVLSSRIRGVVQAIVYLPHFFSWVLVVTLFQQMLGGAGLLNTFLRSRGWEPVDIMTNPDTFIGLLTVQAVWKDAGWGMIIFLAALSTVDPNLYEASAVDGAGRWRRLWHITLPALRPVILRLGDALTVGFEQILLQRDAVGASTAEVLDTYVYFTGIVAGDWGYGAAAGLIKGAVGLVLVLAANRLAHAVGEQGVYSKR
jgi:putative aldouronate transport system permease protein